jgi:hypothetical protein
MGNGGITPLFLTSALVGGEWPASRPGRYIPGRQPPLPLFNDMYYLLTSPTVVFYWIMDHNDNRKNIIVTGNRGKYFRNLIHFLRGLWYRHTVTRAGMRDEWGIAWEAVLTVSKAFQHLSGWNMNKELGRDQTTKSLFISFWIKADNSLRHYLRTFVPTEICRS